MATRAEVYAALDSERDYHEANYPGERTVAEEILLAEEYLKRARKAWADNHGDSAALDVLRKVGGIVVRCMETNGAPQRDGYYHPALNAKDFEGTNLDDEIPF